MAASTKPGITQQFAAFTLALKYDDLPSGIVEQAKNAILDLLGVAIIGSREDSTRMILQAATGASNNGQATVLGTRTLTMPATAALLNGYAAHALDYDDFQHKHGTHISAPVLPSALALAETLHRSGKDLLTAYVAGFEVGCRLGRAGFAHDLAKCGIHSTGFLGHFGAFAAAGKMIGLNEGQMKCGFGIIAGHAAGLMRSLGTMCKGQNAANAAQNAVLSALLAKQGFTGPEDIFEGKQNIYSVFGKTIDTEELVRDLGHKFEISDNTPKIFSCSGWRNPIVEASIRVAVCGDLQPASISKIVVKASKDVLRFSNYAEPGTGAESKFSTEHAAAVALTDRAGGVAQFSDKRAIDPALAQLRRKVTMEIDEALKPHQIRVMVRTTDGRDLEHFIPAQKGDPLNPISREDLIAKFRANAAVALRPEQIESLVSLTARLDAVTDVAELTHLCRPAVEPA